MPLRVLQFSDVHFCSQPVNQRIEHFDVREQVLADIATLNRFPVDVIVIAGDIAFSGKRQEYQIAGEWLERVRVASGCPRGRFPCPPWPG